MGLFSRKDADPVDGRKGRARVSVSSEAQAAQLRGRARRRLVGAAALVLAAVIVLPMVLDSEPVPVASDIPIVIADRNSPYQPQVGSAETAAHQATPESATPPESTRSSGSVSSPADSGVTPPSTAQTSPQPAATTPSSPSRTAPAPKPEPTPPAAPRKPEPAPAPRPAERTDDGSRALALLEGRTASEAPRPAASRSTNAYVLQVAAYGAQADAQARRDKLKGSGISNAFVETATVNGKQQYRLRVGPFPTREAAQAAQARLRTLGYDNGFIAAQ